MSSRRFQRLLPLELGLIRYTSFLRQIPVLRHLHRQVTARLTPLGEDSAKNPAFRLDFQTPYLHLPVEIDRDQIGARETGTGFSPAAFRFFDWHSAGISRKFAPPKGSRGRTKSGRIDPREAEPAQVQLLDEDIRNQHQ